MNIIIRRIGLQDVAALAEMGCTTFYDTFVDTCTAEDMRLFLEQYFIIAQVEKEISNRDDYYYFAELEGKPVGYMRFGEDYEGLPIMKQWKALELKRFYVLKEYHGKQIAQKMMDFMLEYAAKNKFEVVWLGVWENNFKAQKFYEKYQFVYSGHTHDFPIGGTPQTDKWFWKFLK